MFQSKEEEFNGRVREFESKEKDFEGRVREFQSKEKDFEEARKFEVKRLEVQMEDLKSKENQCEGQAKELELIDSHYEALIKLSEEEIESDDQSSLTIDGRSLQLLPSDRTEILDNLQGLSDPSKVVLDIIQNPIFRMGDNAVIIGDSHILLLEQLMRISPHIEPHVREEAMKLALHLKSNISENTENSVVVVGFLLLLSIYGLAPSFDEDEVYKLFGFAAQHKITVELFGTLGFADKAS
ncbi:frigida-LIKE protein, partial [Trifolium pratense]